MTNNSLSKDALVLAVDIGTTSLKAAFVSAAGEVFDFKRIEYWTAGDNCSQDRNRAASWTAALGRFFPSELARRCAAVSVSGNGPTIVAADGMTLPWRAPNLTQAQNAGEENCSKAQEGAVSDNAAQTDCKPKTAAACGQSLFEKIEIPDAQKKIYEPRLAAFKELFPDVWQKSPSLYTSTQWLCGWIKNNAASLGLARGVSVFDAGPDFIAALVGTATLFPGRLCDRAGSSEGLNLCSPKFFEAPNLRTMPSPAKGFWNVSYLISDPGSSQKEKLDNFKKAFNALKEAAAANGIPFGGRVVVTGGQARDKDLLVAKEAAAGATITTAQIPDAELLGGAAAAFFRLGTYSSLEEAALGLVKLNSDACEEKSRPTQGGLACDSSVRGGQASTGGDSSVTQEAFPRLYSVPSDIKAIIFDIDSTLYTNAAYAFEQVDCQVRRFASIRGITNEEARKMVADYRKKYAAENGGKKVSLSNTLRSFGVSIEQSVQWRRELIEPADFLGPDKKLQEALAALGRRYKLLCVTNNPILPAQKTLDALGVADLIEVLVGLDTCNLSKPAKEPFERAAKEAGVPFGKIVSVGDRYDLDLAPALELGMGGVLVRGVEDVYKLPELI